jgi:Protein of unknown function (DUF3365)
MKTGLVFAVLGTLAACSTAKKETGGIAPQKMTDGIYAVISADRTVYTREVVNRLQNEKVIKATEHFKDEKALPLPAQMLRMGAEIVQKADVGFTYALLSDWPINRQNAPVTDVERNGLKQVAANQKPFYAEEKLGQKRFFTAVYPDKAVAEACVTCHNDNPDSPRSDFKRGDVMGGVVVRIPID